MSQTDKIIIEPPLDELAMQPLNKAETTQLDPPASASVEVKTRPWPVSVLSLLLLLQAGGFFDLGLFFFTSGLGLTRSLIMEALLVEPINTLAEGIVFIPLSLLALLAAIGFARLWRTAWLLAMLLQGLSLLTALVLYFYQQPGYVYFIMLYSIIMVIYLNYFEVYATFQPISILEEPEDEP
jgi:hypothetical protein